MTDNSLVVILSLFGMNFKRGFDLARINCSQGLDKIISGGRHSSLNFHFYFYQEGIPIPVFSILCAIQFLRYPSPPPGNPVAKNENQDAVPWVGIKDSMLF